MEATVQNGTVIVFMHPDGSIESVRVNARGQFRPTSYRSLNSSAKMAVFTSRKREGDISRIADETGYSPSYVSRVMRGQRTSKRIVNAAYDMARGRMKNSSKS